MASDAIFAQGALDAVRAGAAVAALIGVLDSVAIVAVLRP